MWHLGEGVRCNRPITALGEVPVWCHCAGWQSKPAWFVNSGGLSANRIRHQGKDSWSSSHRIHALRDSKRHLQPRIQEQGSPKWHHQIICSANQPTRTHILHPRAPGCLTLSKASFAFPSAGEHVSSLKAGHSLPQVKSKYEDTKEQNKKLDGV